MEKKEAMEILRKHYANAPFSERTALETFIPELKESEDEKIRKELIHFFKNHMDSVYEEISDNNVVIAWLEKQGEHKHIVPKFKIGDTIKCKHDDRVFTIQSIDLEKGIYIYTAPNCGNDIDYADEEFELVEQKPVKNIVETWKDMRLEVYQQASGNRHELNYSDDTTKMFSLNDIDEIIEKMSEQKPADKDVPKFKVGDWILIAGRTGQIILIQEKYIVFQDTDGKNVLSDSPYRLWTIQDAKDGDVLVASDNSIFLFKGLIDCACKHYVALTTDGDIEFNVGLKHFWETSRAVHPATNEQRDLLFAKMKEIGYEWDNNCRQ